MHCGVQIWDVLDHRRVRRTYLGHAGAVRQVAFGADGSEFLSCSYDRTVKAWDTETGACTGSYGNGKVRCASSASCAPARVCACMRVCEEYVYEPPYPTTRLARY